MLNMAEIIILICLLPIGRTSSGFILPPSKHPRPPKINYVPKPRDWPPAPPK
jgi:hypothetical protein